MYYLPIYVSDKSGENTQQLFKYVSNGKQEDIAVTQYTHSSFCE